MAERPGPNVRTSQKNPLADAKEKVTVIFGGKTGAGKSTLITTLLKIQTVSGGEVSGPEHPEEYGPSPEPTTQECQAYYVKMNDAILEVIDTVGLISGEDMSRKLKEIATFTDCKADLLVYCLHVGPGLKFVDGNPAMMQALQNEFSKEIWKHCILVFTFSNLMWERFRSKNEDEDLAVSTYLDYIRRYAACFERQLQSMGVQDIDVRTIFDPIKVKGRHTIVAVPAGLEFTDEVLPNIKQDEKDRWMGIVLREMIESCRQEKKALFKKYREGLSWGEAITTAAVVIGAVLIAIASSK